MKRVHFNLNMDCGEELPGIFADIDHLMMPYLKYCNIACGYHAGSEATIRKNLALAVKYGVKAGAHPSFKDKQNFGRNYIEVPYPKLVGQIKDQLVLLNELAKEVGIELFHAKAHGALYNAAMKNEKEANAIVEAVLEINKNLVIFVTKGSVLENTAKQNGCKILYETFGDRGYLDVYTLVPRSQPGALKDKASEVIEQIMMLSQGKVSLSNGKATDIASDTICLHGDHPEIFNTLALLKNLS